MQLTSLRIRNFRSITDTDNISITKLQAFVGENNAGKSNILGAISCFLTSGAGGMRINDFKDVLSNAYIDCTFSNLSNLERQKLRPYLINNEIILQKKLWVETDARTGKSTVKSEYHGYQAEPTEVAFSIQKITDQSEGRKIDWATIGEEAGILEYVQDENGRVNKTSYIQGLKSYLEDNEVEYDEPELGDTQALGIPQNLLSYLPKYYLLPAITDYSDEIDRRSSSTVFRRLMGDLADRVMMSDPRYTELDTALNTVRSLLNPEQEEGEPDRLAALNNVEESLRDLIKKLMPSVQSVNLGVEVEATKDIFSKGVNIKIDDGVLTDVLDKGNGMQRSLVFALLQMLISNSKNNQRDGEGDNNNEHVQPIILAIEEPELYIHPHSQRLIFKVLKEFSGVEENENTISHDQILYTTHSTSFIEVWNYERIGMVQKPSPTIGTIVKQAPAGTLDETSERRTFKVLTSFGLEHNEVFFGQEAIIVEGVEDAVGIIAAARKLGRIEELLDEIGITVLIAGGKGEIPKFQKILNAFDIGYGVLLEKDGRNDRHNSNMEILNNLNGNRIGSVPRRVEDYLGHNGHFGDQKVAKDFFSDPNNINADFETLVSSLLPPLN